MEQVSEPESDAKSGDLLPVVNKGGRPKGSRSGVQNLKGRHARNAVSVGVQRANKRLRDQGRPTVPRDFDVLSRMVELAIMEEDPIKEYAMLKEVLPFANRKLAPVDPEREREREKEDAAKESGIGTIIQAIRQAEADSRELIGVDQSEDAQP